MKTIPICANRPLHLNFSHILCPNHGENLIISFNAFVCDNHFLTVLTILTYFLATWPCLWICFLFVSSPVKLIMLHCCILLWLRIIYERKWKEKKNWIMLFFGFDLPSAKRTSMDFSHSCQLFASWLQRALCLHQLFLHFSSRSIQIYKCVFCTRTWRLPCIFKRDQMPVPLALLKASQLAVLCGNGYDERIWMHYDCRVASFLSFLRWNCQSEISHKVSTRSVSR